MLSGAVSSTGIEIGNILILPDMSENQENLRIAGDPDSEMVRFETALSLGIGELEDLRREVRQNIGEKEERIFSAQSMILDDPLFVDEIRDRIRREGHSAETAINETMDQLEKIFLEIEDPTIKQRIADIRDVGGRLISCLGPGVQDRLKHLNSPVIIVSRDVLPSQAVQLERDKVLAIITEKGGINSHASIIARSLGIPAVVGIKGLVESAETSRTAIVDGVNGHIYLDPDPGTIYKYQQIRKNYHSEKFVCVQTSETGVVRTLDGDEVSIYANIGNIAELNRLKNDSVEGIGVLRTEFMIMDMGRMPAVEEMAQSFKTVLEFMNPHPVNIRLLDLGADKRLPFLTYPDEANPSLGSRGIRFLLDRPELLKTQLRAILTASPYGNARILVPMVTDIQEIKGIVSLVRQMEREMSDENVPIKNQIPVGIMIETPAVAILADRFVQSVDYMSVGTNDLTQYVMAADRENEGMQLIYNSLNPALLCLLEKSLNASQKADREISICGEMASNPIAVPVLLGLGYRTLSLGVGRIPEIKDIIAKISIQKARKLARKALKAASALEVERMASRFLKKMEKDFIEKS